MTLLSNLVYEILAVVFQDVCHCEFRPFGRQEGGTCGPDSSGTACYEDHLLIYALAHFRKLDPAAAVGTRAGWSTQYP